MDEKKLWECLKRSGDTVAVPESLLPDRMEKKLQEQKKHQAFRKARVFRMLAAAACAILCVGVLALARPWILNQGSKDSAAGAEGTASMEAGTAQATKPENTVRAENSESSGGTQRDTEEIAASESEICTAEDYGEIYDMLKDRGFSAGEVQEEEKKQSAAAGAYVYELTEITLSLPEETREECLSDRGLKSWFPQTGGRTVAAEDCWILWGGGARGYLLTAVSEEDPGEAADTKLILTEGAEVSLTGEGAVFLGEGENEGKLAKITFDEGKISYSGPGA